MKNGRKVTCVISFLKAEPFNTGYQFSITHSKENLAHSFANLMFAGKRKSALDLLPTEGKGVFMHLFDQINTDSQNTYTDTGALISITEFASFVTMEKCICCEKMCCSFTRKIVVTKFGHINVIG